MKIQSFKNVWDAIEDDPVERASLRIRSDLMIEILKYFKQSDMTQKEAARFFGTTQEQFNDVLRGKIQRCSIDQLVNMLTSAGFILEVSVSADNDV